LNISKIYVIFLVSVNDSWEDAKLSLQLSNSMVVEQPKTARLSTKAKKVKHSRLYRQKLSFRLFGGNGLFAGHSKSSSEDEMDNGMESGILSSYRKAFV
jgi:hypothetical protein